MKIWLINLDKDQARLRWMSDQLFEMRLPFERFTALAPSDLNEDQRRYAASPLRRNLKPGEVGCLLSHISVWRAIADGADQTALILEDDVHFAPDFGDFFRMLSIDGNEVCIHRLETMLMRVTLKREPRYRCGSRTARELLSNHAGGAAYVLTKRTAEILLERIELFQNNVDVELFDPLRGAASFITIYQWTPALCIQDVLVGNQAANGFESNIPHSADMASGVFREPRPQRIKDALRPFYTLAYDLALAPSGRARQHVRFR